MSTVGSASATGSTGGRTTTWASGSQKGQTDVDDEDQMSMDANYRDIDDRDRYSTSAMDEDMDGDAMSDDTSLVGFGEGAGSTVSGPTYSRRDLASSPAIGKNGLASQLQSSGGGTPVRSMFSCLECLEMDDSQDICDFQTLPCSKF
jgi:transcription elongation factor